MSLCKHAGGLDTPLPVKTVPHHAKGAAHREFPAAICRAGRHHQVSISAGAFVVPGPAGPSPHIQNRAGQALERVGARKHGRRGGLNSLRLHLRPCRSHSDGVYPSRQSGPGGEPATRLDFIGRNVGDAEQIQKKPLSLRSKHDIWAGTSDQTPYVVIFCASDTDRHFPFAPK